MKNRSSIAHQNSARRALNEDEPPDLANWIDLISDLLVEAKLKELNFDNSVGNETCDDSQEQYD
jgi:hypothetical protein